VQPRPIAQVLGMSVAYYMLRETVFGQDGNFSYDALCRVQQRSGQRAWDLTVVR